jgi:hypothetical protein
VNHGPDIEEQPRDVGDYPEGAERQGQKPDARAERQRQQSYRAEEQGKMPILRFRGHPKDILVSKELWKYRFE